jgi:hypothetical protein
VPALVSGLVRFFVGILVVNLASFLHIGDWQLLNLVVTAQNLDLLLKGVGVLDCSEAEVLIVDAVLLLEAVD